MYRKIRLTASRESPFDLEAFSDSDYGGSNLDRKSTTGGCQFLGQRLISWQCFAEIVDFLRGSNLRVDRINWLCNIATALIRYPCCLFSANDFDIKQKNKPPLLAVSLTTKIFGNINRGFRGAPREPLLPSMLLVLLTNWQDMEHAAVAHYPTLIINTSNRSQTNQADHGKCHSEVGQEGKEDGKILRNKALVTPSTKVTGFRGREEHVKIIKSKQSSKQPKTLSSCSSKVKVYWTREGGYKRRKVAKGDTAEGVNTGSIKLSTGDEKLSTGNEQVSTVGAKKSTSIKIKDKEKEKSSTMDREDTHKKSKEKFLQEEASLVKQSGWILAKSRGG
ncbi:hypothetical protein Tco_0071256 [Tanacetum coccineum]